MCVYVCIPYTFRETRNDKRTLTIIFISASIDFYITLACLAYIIAVLPNAEHIV